MQVQLMSHEFEERSISSIQGKLKQMFGGTLAVVF